MIYSTSPTSPPMSEKKKDFSYLSCPWADGCDLHPDEQMNKWGSGGCNVLKDYSIKFPWFTAQVPSILYGTGINCIILWIRLVSERWCYSLTSSLIGWAHSQNDPWWRLRDPTPAVKWCICHIPRAQFKYPIGCLIARPRKVSKLQDLYLELYDHSEIWWLGAIIISQMYHKLKLHTAIMYRACCSMFRCFFDTNIFVYNALEIQQLFTVT